MKSISIVSYTRPTHPGGAHALTEIARHFETTWSTAVAYIDEHTWLESDAEGNLMVLKQNVGGITPEDKRILHTISEIRLGEMVNKIQRVEVEESGSAVVLPRAFMGTVSKLVLSYFDSDIPLAARDSSRTSTNSCILIRSMAPSTFSPLSLPQNKIC